MLSVGCQHCEPSLKPDASHSKNIIAATAQYETPAMSRRSGGGTRSGGQRTAISASATQGTATATVAAVGNEAIPPANHEEPATPAPTMAVRTGGPAQSGFRSIAICAPGSGSYPFQ